MVLRSFNHMPVKWYSSIESNRLGTNRHLALADAFDK